MLSGRHAMMTDFGIARALSNAVSQDTLTTAGVTIGTPTYMSPEQAAAEQNIGHRSDIYSVGVLAYELLTGRPPPEADTTRGVIMGHITAQPNPLASSRDDLPPVLVEVVERCLEKEPANRWQGADEIVSRLEIIASSASKPFSSMRPRAILVGSRFRNRWEACLFRDCPASERHLPHGIHRKARDRADDVVHEAVALCTQHPPRQSPPGLITSTSLPA